MRLFKWREGMWPSSPAPFSGVFLGLWTLSGHWLAGHGDSIPPSIFWPQAESPLQIPCLLPMSLSDCPNSHLKVLPTHNLVSLQFINGIGSVVIFLNHGCKIVSLPVKNTSVLLMALKNQVCASLPPLLPPSLPLPFPLLLPSLHGSRGLTLFIISSFATLLMPS